MTDTSTLGPSAGHAATSPATATLERAALEQGAYLEGRQPALPRGFTIGRYVVLERIGQGGMGAVYASYDPELDRRVALKVLRRAGPSGTDAEDDPAAAARLLGEARALARLQHANVLRVYDVGTDRGQVFVTTELLVGADVAAWAVSRPRTWSEIVGVFLAIGQGLAAAHAEGLVHCDVKPSNMMVCDDGRVLLVDFGIAAEAPGGEGQVLDSGVLDVAPGALRRLRAAAGRQDVPAGGTPGTPGAGTPGYMAPEQERGERVTPAADVYAYCLSLSRVLFGRAPGDPELPSKAGAAAGAAPAGGSVFAPPALPLAVARRLRGTIDRGLGAEPAGRPAMAEILAVLRALRARGRRRLLAIAGVAAAAGLFTFARGLFAPPESCFGGEARFAAVWNDKSRQALASRFASGAGSGGGLNELFAASRTAIEHYGREWSDQGEAWCREGRSGASSALLLDLRGACLDQRLRELEASLALATSRRELEPARVADLFAGLVPIAVCADTRALRAPAEVELDPAQQAELEELRRGQAALRALWTAGVMREGRDALPPLLERARRLGHLPLAAELLYQRGVFEDALVDENAAATLEEAALTAGASRHDRANAEALIRLVRVAGLRQERFAEAQRFAELARAALAGLGRPGLLSAELDDYEGLIARQQGDYARALELHERALSARRLELGENHPGLATSHLRLGNLLDDQDRQAEARRHLEKALEIQLAVLGPAHPAIAETYTRLGTLAREEGRLEEARDFHEKALALRRRVLGDERPPVAESRTYLGELAALRGDLELARGEFQAAAAILVRELGADHSRLGVLLATEASAFTEAGLDREAVAPYSRALAIFEKSLGAAHPQVGVLAYNLGAVHLRLGEFPAALEAFRRAAAIFTASVGQESSLYWNARGGQGEALERLGQDAEARVLLEAVLEADRRLAGDARRGAKFRADTAFALARLLLRSHIVARARELAATARELYLESPEGSRRELAELDGWLARSLAG